MKCQNTKKKMVKVSKLVQRKLIRYRSILGLGHFKGLNILEIFQDSCCAYRDLTIKSKFFKNIFAVLLIHNINHTAEKSSKTDSK